MATVKEIYQHIDALAPFVTQEDFDNAGLLVGRGNAQVDTVLVALDITRPVIGEAIAMGAQLIVAHHPVIFHPIKSVTDDHVTGGRVLLLAEHGIAAICAHTNLDAAQEGVNDLLARAVGLAGIHQLCQSGVDGAGRPYGIGRVGVLNAEPALTVSEFAAKVKEKLKAADVRYADVGKRVCKVAVGGGSCGSMLRDAVTQGCDTFVTADVKYDVFLEAKELGVNILDAGHFATEDVVTGPLAEYIQAQFPGMTVKKSVVHTEVFRAL